MKNIVTTRRVRRLTALGVALAGVAATVALGVSTGTSNVEAGGCRNVTSSILGC